MWGLQEVRVIQRSSFDHEWIDSVREEFGGDSYVIEKAIHAFALLEQLCLANLDFVFKGGTSLLLLLGSANRLSIDIDIVSEVDDNKLHSTVSEISSISPFTGVQRHDRGERGLPNREHYQFFYHSVITHEKDFVILDVVKDRCLLPCMQMPVDCFLLSTAGNSAQVTVPRLEALLADKLTAFAPQTIGVPFITANGDPHALQVVKQLFDVGELFNHIRCPERVSEAYQISFAAENAYHENSFSLQEVLADTKHHCLRICGYNVKGYKENDVTGNLKAGITGISSHLLNTRFRIDKEAKTAAAKAYLLCQYIAGNCSLAAERIAYDVQFLHQNDAITLPDEITHLERLKSVHPQAYYYLLQTSMN